eukprot:m51a1_g13829 hypothetical protein (360) ;mRNA; f:484673-486020
MDSGSVCALPAPAPFDADADDLSPDARELLELRAELGEFDVQAEMRPAADGASYSESAPTPRKPESSHDDASSLEIPAPAQSPSGRGSRGRYFLESTIVCYRCNKQGHIAAECTEKWCPVCRTVGHMAMECPKRTCRRCGEVGHYARECPASSFARRSLDSSQQQQQRCYRCGETGHLSYNCRGQTPQHAQAPRSRTPSSDDYAPSDHEEGASAEPPSKRRAHEGGRRASMPAATKASSSSAVSCYNCGSLGHAGEACRRPSFEDMCPDTVGMYPRRHFQEESWKKQRDLEIFGPRVRPSPSPPPSGVGRAERFPDSLEVYRRALFAAEADQFVAHESDDDGDDDVVVVAERKSTPRKS